MPGPGESAPAILSFLTADPKTAPYLCLKRFSGLGPAGKFALTTGTVFFTNILKKEILRNRFQKVKTYLGFVDSEAVTFVLLCFFYRFNEQNII